MPEPEERIRRARAAQAEWIAKPFHERRSLLKTLRHLLLEHAEQLLAVVREELGKPELDTLSGDLMVTLEQMLYYERSTEKALRSRKASASWIFFRGTRTREVYEPHGVVLVIAPWNYPVQLSIIPTITALYAGNAVLCKCSEHAPRTAALLAKIFSQARLPEALVQFSWEQPESAARLLEAGPDFVFFTGSNSAGTRVAARAGELLVPSAMELGGKDAALVFASCHFERTLNGLAYGAFSNAGQVCVGTKRIYVESSILERFCKELHARASMLRLGQDIGIMPVERLRAQFNAQLADARAKGASFTDASGQSVTQILTDVPDDAVLLTQEAFGPVVCIAGFRDEAEAIALANNTAFGLSASIWTSDRAQAKRVAEALKVGSCVVNDVIRNVSHPGAAFGGVKASGYGRYHGREGLRTFSRIKTIMTVTDRSSHQINWFPFTQRTQARLFSLLAFRHGRGGRLQRLIKMMTEMRRAH